MPVRRVRKSRANAGETLVEVLVSVFLFLMLAAVLEGAVSYSSAALKKNKQIRADQAAILTSFAETEADPGAEQTISFQAVSSDFTQKGNLVFQVPVRLDEKKVDYQDTKGQQQQITFYLYGSAGSGGDDAGGDTP